jgi:iron complex outermembrane receptor protein
MPGGPLQASLGGELQRRRKEALSPDAAASGQIDSFGNFYVVGSQRVFSVYGELLAPVSDALTLEAAARYERYNQSGGRLGPRVGLNWKLTPEFGVRATAGRGFRAPGPAENGTSGRTYYAGTSSDPVLCPTGDPAKPGTFPSQCAVLAATLIASNRSLAPETSTSFGLGLVYRPVDEVGVTLDFFSIDVRNQIVIGPSREAVRGTNLAPIPQLQPDGTFVSVAPPVAPIAYYQLSYVNANRTRTSGFDLHVRARHRIKDVGAVSSDLSLTHVNKYDLEIGGTVYRLAGTHGPFGVSGNSGNPKTRVSWMNTFEGGRWSVTGTLNYISGFDLTDPSAGLDDCAAGLTVGAGSRPFAGQLQGGTIPSAVSCRVSAFTTFDLVGAIDVTRQLRLQASILNVFDKRAPEDWGTFGGSGRPYNRVLHSKGGIGRFLGIEARYVF